MSKMTTKGQVTIPKRMRDHLGLKPGSEVEFAFGRGDNIVLKTRARREKSRFATIRGSADFGMTTDEIMRFLRGDPDE